MYKVSSIGFKWIYNLEMQKQLRLQVIDLADCKFVLSLQYVSEIKKKYIPLGATQVINEHVHFDHIHFGAFHIAPETCEAFGAAKITWKLFWN